MKIKAHTFFTGVLFFLLLASLLHAQEGETEEEEAPEYIWSYQIDDSNVDFYWDGYWRFHLSTGLAVSVEDGEWDWGATYSDYTEGFLFEQTPDLLLSLWIDNRYFFETSVVEDYDYNTYLLGYQGQEEEYLQSVMLGNTSITTDSYATLPVSSPEYNTPGITAKGNTDKMQNELMIRFDGTTEDSKLYIGSYEADEEYTEIYNYLENRRFILPDADVDSDDLTVYIRDDDGEYAAATSSYTYRLAEEGDYLLDRDKGILTMEDDVTGPIAVFYTLGTDDIGDNTDNGQGSVIPPTSTDSGIPDVDGTALNFSWTADDPYDTQNGTWWESRGESIDGNDCLLIYEPDRFSPFAVYSRYSYSQSLSSDSWKNDLTLADRNGDETDGPDDLSWEADTSDKIITLYRSDYDDRDALNRYPLGDIHQEIYGNAPYGDSDLVSEQLRLQVKSGSGSYSLGSGVVAGSVTITINGVSEYNYDLDSDTGTITFNRYIFPDDRIEISYRRETLDFEGQEMLIYQGNRFTLNEKNTLETAASFNWVFPDGSDYSTPDGGTVSLGASWEHTGDFYSLRTELTGEADLGDADGLQSVLAMEDALSSYGVYEDALAEPKAGAGETDNDYGEGDYVAMNDGEGPLAADSDTSTFDDTYMLDAGFTLANSTDWTGADIHLTSSGTADYSTLQEINFYIRVTGGTPGDLVVKLGETGEYDDFDDDDYVEDYDESLVATEVIDRANLSTSWQQVTWELDSDDRQKLSKTRSLRFIFAGTSGGNSDVDDLWAADSYQVYIGGIELVGQTFALSLTDSDGSLTVSQTEEEDGALESAYSDEIDQFHSDGEDQRVAVISWEGMTDSSDKWEAVSWIDAQDPTEFGQFIFFVKHGTTEGSYSLEFTDTDEEGIRLAWEPTSTDWQKVTVDLTENTATFDGGAQNVTLAVDEGVTSLSRVYFSGEGITEDSNLKVDELYFEESILALSGKSAVTLNIEKQEILRGAGGFPWLANASLDLSAYASATSRTGGMAGDEGSISGQLQTGIDLMYLGISLQGDGSWEDNAFALWGGHGLQFPSVASPLVLEESFALGDDSDTPLLSHTASAELALADSFAAKGDHEAVLEQGELAQDWSGEISGSGDKWKGEIAADWAIESEEEEKHSSGYFTVWGDSWSYALPDTDDVSDRTTDGDFSLQYKGESFSPRLSVSVSTDLDYSSDWEQTSELDSALSFPITFTGNRNITLTPEYSRSLSFTEEEDYSGSFAADYENWAGQILPLLPLTHFIPLWELADSEDVMEVLPTTGTYSYTPELSLTLSRNYGSRASDLFLPSLVDASFSRLYKGETVSRYFKNSWDFTVQQRALNLFGSFGVHPLFSFYTTEEIANTFTLTLEEKNTYLPAWESFTWNCYGRFETEEGSTFTLENDLNYSSEDLEEQLTAEFDWKTERKPYRKIPLSQYILDSESYVRNGEELSYAYSFSDGEYSHEIAASHTSTLYMDDLGTLAGWYKLGVQWTDSETSMGTELGLELTLTF